MEEKKGAPGVRVEFSGTLLQAHQPEQEMRRDEEAKAHEATRGQSPPLRGRCSWKTPPLTASFLTSPRSQTGALPAPAFLSCWRAYPQHGSQERQTTEEVRRSQEEHTSHAGGRQKRGPKSLPPAGRPAGRPSAGTAQGDGCREQPGSACTREPQSPLQVGKRAAGIQTRTGSRDEAHGLGRARGAGPRRSAQPPLPQRKRSAQGGIAPFAGGQQRSVAFFLTAAFRRRRVTPLADHPTPGKAHGPAGSGGSRHGAGTAASPPAAARGQPPPRAAPTPPPRPAAAPQPPAASRRASRAARRALSEGPARSRRRERRRAARPALTARLHCGAPRGPSARSDRRTRIQGAPTAARGRAPSARLREGARGRGRGRGRPSRAQAATPPHAHILSATPSGRAHSFLNTAGRVIGREDDGRWGRPRPAGRDWATRMPIPIGAVGG